MSSGQPPPQFGRRGAPPSRAAPETRPAAPSEGLKRSAVIALATLGVGAIAYAALPSGKSCEDRKRENPGVDCANARSTAFFFFSSGAAHAPAATTAGSRPPIPDIAPKAASTSMPAVARGGFGATAAGFSHSSGA